ncbi:hypothetical protein YN1_8020 [Nanoarchaeota archaeon]
MVSKVKLSVATGIISGYALLYLITYIDIENGKNPLKALEYTTILYSIILSTAYLIDKIGGYLEKRKNKLIYVSEATDLDAILYNIGKIYNISEKHGKNLYMVKENSKPILYIIPNTDISRYNLENKIENYKPIILLKDNLGYNKNLGYLNIIGGNENYIKEIINISNEIKKEKYNSFPVIFINTSSYKIDDNNLNIVGQDAIYLVIGYLNRKGKKYLNDIFSRNL